MRTLKYILNANVKERKIYAKENVEIRKQFCWDFKGELPDTFKALEKINEIMSLKYLILFHDFWIFSSNLCMINYYFRCAFLKKMKDMKE